MMAGLPEYKEITKVRVRKDMYSGIFAFWGNERIVPHLPNRTAGGNGSELARLPAPARFANTSHVHIGAAAAQAGILKPTGAGFATSAPVRLRSRPRQRSPSDQGSDG